eukprot:TRINITY_DN4390_c0_g1_i1.p1 TRINITY_DN4390_c0_g1~~TRINITY_DN4390_c0_g1_i1.p1  ORF type:complete len:346 (-),score=66.38 TRINITY_DN4390_c0_g1_i1:1169-2206(-)
MGQKLATDNDGNKINVWGVSDLHVDHDTNMEAIVKWMDFKKEGKFGEKDVLILAGDISTSIELMVETFKIVKSVFNRVFFVPGNNELRLERKERGTFKNSINKFKYILELCEKLGIETKPAKISSDLIIIPLMSWYSPYFASQFKDTEGTKYQKGWLDFRTVFWPKEIIGDNDPFFTNIESYFIEENKKAFDKFMEENPKVQELWKEKKKGNHNKLRIITLSHMLPHYSLLSKMSVFLKPTLAFVTGSPKLGEQITNFKSDLHFFGHSHIDYNKRIKDTVYIQHSFGHPGEREKWKKTVNPFVPQLISNFSEEDMVEDDNNGENNDEEGMSIIILSTLHALGFSL